MNFSGSGPLSRIRTKVVRIRNAGGDYLGWLLVGDCVEEGGEGTLLQVAHLPIQHWYPSVHLLSLFYKNTIALAVKKMSTKIINTKDVGLTA